MTRSAEAAKGLYVKQKEQGLPFVAPNDSVGLAQLKDEVKFGLMPLGTVFALASNITGAFAPPASGQIKDGFMVCDGAAIPTTALLSGTLPDLTDNRFLMGSTAAGTAGGSDTASGTIGGSQSIAHTHDMQAHTHGHAHTHTIAHTHEHAHTHTMPHTHAMPHTHSHPHTHDEGDLTAQVVLGTSGPTNNTLFTKHVTSPAPWDSSREGSLPTTIVTFPGVSQGAFIDGVTGGASPATTGGSSAPSTGGASTPSTGAASDATTGGTSTPSSGAASPATTDGPSNDTSTAMSANDTVSGSNFTFTGAANGNRPLYLSTVYLIRVK